MSEDPVEAQLDRTPWALPRLTSSPHAIPSTPTPGQRRRPAPIAPRRTQPFWLSRLPPRLPVAPRGPAPAIGSDMESGEEAVAFPRDTLAETLGTALCTAAFLIARQECFQAYVHRVGIASLQASTRLRERLIRLLWAWALIARVEAAHHLSVRSPRSPSP